MKDTPAREAYILMDKIRPPIQYNYLVRGGTEVKLSEVVSELGIFGVLIGYVIACISDILKVVTGI